MNDKIESRINDKYQKNKAINEIVEELYFKDHSQDT